MPVQTWPQLLLNVHLVQVVATKVTVTPTARLLRSDSATGVNTQLTSFSLGWISDYIQVLTDSFSLMNCTVADMEEDCVLTLQTDHSLFGLHQNAFSLPSKLINIGYIRVNAPWFN